MVIAVRIDTYPPIESLNVQHLRHADEELTPLSRLMRKTSR